MLSSDRNVETIGQLFESIKNYIKAQKDCLRVDFVCRLVRIAKVAILMLVAFALVISALLYFSFAFVAWLEPMIGLCEAYLAVAGCYVLVLLLIIILRKPLIERPLVRFLSDILLS